MSWVASLEVDSAGGRLQIEPQSTEAPARLEEGDCSLVLAGAPAANARSVLDAYRARGRDALASLRGAFALVLVDRQAGLAFAVRDPAGAHPLFYEASAEDVRLSPAAEAVARAGGRRPQLNLLEAAAFIARASPGKHETLFDGVRRLPPGHLLEIRTGSIRVERYWEPRGETGPEEAASRLHDLLLRAIERVVDGRAAIFLSGGLDSALVAAVAAEQSRRRGLPPPVALSLAIHGADGDEEPTQREVARLLGLELVLRTPEELAGAEGVLRGALRRAAAPSGRPPELLDALYDDLALLGLDRGCRTVLTGAGGDEWLLPPPGFVADRILRFDMPALLDLSRAWAGYWPGRQPVDAIRGVFWRLGLRAAARSLVVSAAGHVAPERLRRARLARARARIPTWAVSDPDVRRRLLERIVDGTNREPPGRALETQRRALLDSGEFSAAQETTFEQHVLTGVASSAPLVDRDVLEFLYLLDPRRLIAAGRAKALARDVLARRMPHLAGAWPRTVYGDSFWLTTIATEGPAAWAESSEAIDNLRETGLLDADRDREWLVSPELAAPNDLITAWRALSLARWIKSVEER